MFRIVGALSFLCLFFLTSLFNLSYAVNVDITDIPDTISEDGFQVNVNISSRNKAGTVNYLKGSFFIPGENEYFGFTQNNSDAWYNGSDYSQYFKVTCDENGSASAKFNVKIDSNPKYFKGSGKYGFKIKRYTASGKSHSWSNEVLLNVDIKEKKESISLSPPITTAIPLPSVSVFVPPTIAQEDNFSNDLKVEISGVNPEKEVLAENIMDNESSPSPNPSLFKTLISNKPKKTDSATDSANQNKKTGKIKHKSLVLGGASLIAVSIFMFIIKLFLFKKF